MTDDLVLPDVELVDPSGVVLLRTGFVVTFFLPGEPLAHIEAVQRAISASIMRVDQLRALYVADARGQFVELTGAARHGVAHLRLGVAGSHTQFLVLDSPVAAPRFSAQYCGLDPAKAASMDWSNATCGLAFCFGLDLVEGEGFVRLHEFAEELAAMLPFSTGYVAPAFVHRDGVGAVEAFAAMRGLSARYRCLDIPALLPDCFEVGDGPKGAYWGNYLSAAAVDELGGEKAVRQAMRSPEIRVRGIGTRGLAIHLGESPIAGDSNRRADVGAYQSAFRLIEPAVRPRTVPYMEFDDEAMWAWIYRFGTT